MIVFELGQLSWASTAFAKPKFGTLTLSLFVLCLLTATTSHDRRHELRGRPAETNMHCFVDSFCVFHSSIFNRLARSFAVGPVTQAI